MATAHSNDKSGAAAWVRDGREGASWVVRAGGRWTLTWAAPLQARMAQVAPTGVRSARIDMTAIEALDTSGAWLLRRMIRRLEGGGLAVEIAGASSAHKALLERVNISEERRALARPYVSPVREIVEHLGEVTIRALVEVASLINFLGLTLATLGRALLHPKRLRTVSFFAHVERIGLNAVPIVGLLSFLIGVVLAYQGADQLKQFGAEIFTVNLLGITVLREVGVLLTAIIVAGRSGSAFTAEIGIMKINEEVDAMSTLGLDPVEVLVLPRLIAMMVALPLLSFYADVMAMAGGAIMVMGVLDVSFNAFAEQLKSAITLGTIWVGLVKSPVFAFLIALVGCYEGLKVSGSAESVGLLTTRSVVVSIFLVIVVDAAFSVFFSFIGV